ncbi:hypothetical protein Peur_018961 [Populus x canadensis]
MLHTRRDLQLEYLDLYLIHWPASSRSGTYEFLINKEDFLPMDFKFFWEAMQDCQDLGLTKSIGVSNFSYKKLSDIFGFAKIPPAVNQVCLRWAYEQEVCVVVKSFNNGRIKENLEIFNRTLSEEESMMISEIPQAEDVVEKITS